MGNLNGFDADSGIEKARADPVVVAAPDGSRACIIGTLSGASCLVEVVGQSDTAETAVRLCQQQEVDVLVLHVGSIPGRELRSIGAIRQRCAPSKLLLCFDALTDEELVAALHAGTEGMIEQTSTAAEFVTAIRRISSGGLYLCSRSSRGLARRLRALYPPAENQESPLTPREQQVVQLIAGGWTNKEIAAELNLSCGTIDTHRRNSMSKLGTHNAAELIRYCHERGWLSW